jgi:GTPase
MSFRLDEGDGSCMYRIGVEDDGCHSLIDYDACSETAKLLEYLARSLNAVVVERNMIQNEVMDTLDGVAVKGDEESGDVVVVTEDSLLGDGKDQLYDDDHYNQHEDNSYAKGDDDDNDDGSTNRKEKHRILNKTRGVYTRCDLTVHRVETHLLDPSPIHSSNNNNNSDGAKIRRANGNSSPTTFKSKNNTSGGEENMSVGETLSARNIRVAVVGNVDAGKSTMIGTLISSLLDDGRGSSRTSIMKHRHEIESGRTSTASTHLLGFRSTGEAVAGKDSVRANRRMSEDEIARESYRVITLMDLAGHEKYLKTT